MREKIGCATNKYKRLCFLHIPKTAGTSISSILSYWYPDKLIFKGGDKLDYDKYSKEELSEYRLYKGHIQYIYANPNLPSDTSFVTLLREPIERVISLYYFWQGYSDEYLSDPNVDEIDKLGPRMAKSMGILEFFSRNDLHMLILRATRNGQLSYITTIKKNLIEKQNSKILIKNVRENMKYISVFGVQSQLPFFVYELRKLLGISEPVMVPHINASKRNKHFARLPSLDRQKLIDIISDNNQAEIEVYNEIENKIRFKIEQFIEQF
jgi:hypothetical protein